MNQDEIARIRTWEEKYANEICKDWSPMDATSWARYFADFKAKPSLYKTMDERFAECPFFSRTSGSRPTTAPQTSSEQLSELNPERESEQLALHFSSPDSPARTPRHRGRAASAIRSANA